MQIKQTPGCYVAMAGRICIINNSYHETFFMKFSVVLSALRASTKAANIEEVECVLLANAIPNPSHYQESIILVLLAKWDELYKYIQGICGELYQHTSHDDQNGWINSGTSLACSSVPRSFSTIVLSATSSSVLLKSESNKLKNFSYSY